MKRLQFITLLAWPKFGWLQDVRVQRIDWGRPLVELGGMTYMLLSSSYGEESVQRVDTASGQRAFNNACRTCHDPRPRSHLWRHRHSSIACHGHLGQAYRTGFTLAERLRCIMQLMS